MVQICISAHSVLSFPIRLSWNSTSTISSGTWTVKLHEPQVLHLQNRYTSNCFIGLFSLIHAKCLEHSKHILSVSFANDNEDKEEGRGSMGKTEEEEEEKGEGEQGKEN